MKIIEEWNENPKGIPAKQLLTAFVATNKKEGKFFELCNFVKPFQNRLQYVNDACLSGQQGENVARMAPLNPEKITEVCTSARSEAEGTSAH